METAGDAAMGSARTEHTRCRLVCPQALPRGVFGPGGKPPALRRHLQTNQALRARKNQEAAAAAAADRTSGVRAGTVVHNQRPSSTTSATSASDSPDAEWNEEWNLPRVTKKVDYNSLLRDIRLERVKEVHFFPTDGTDMMFGWCIVNYIDGSIASSFVEPDDFRMAYAMETHGVTATRIGNVPSRDELRPPKEWSAQTMHGFVSLFAAVAVGLIYLATHLVRQRKGDAEDREKIRRKKQEERRLKQRQIVLEKIEEEVVEQFKLGTDIDDMIERFQLAEVGITKSEIEKILVQAKLIPNPETDPSSQGATSEEPESGVFYNKDSKKQLEDEEAFRQQKLEEAAAMDPNSHAEDMLSLKTMRIREARNPERQRQLREAQQKLKGVKLQYSDADTVFFDDVAGIGPAKLELQEVVDFFIKPERFRESGAKVPRGVLLCGPPGTGKTLLARAVAGEAGVAFLSINASEFVEMFVGVGAARVRDLFSTARAAAPAIVFIDEIDSVGRARGSAQGNDERDQTLNQLLTEMDGFNSEAAVVVMAASNRRDVLDPALVRPGRFDRSVYVGLPDFEGRIEILRVHLDRREWDREGVDLHTVAFETRGYSGARLANLVNMAAVAAGRRGADRLEMADLERALEHERLGPPRSRYSDSARRRLALVEAATATLATLLPAIEPVARATVVARETYPWGHTVVEPNEQRELTNVWTRRYLLEQLIVIMAGRAVEEAVYGRDGVSSVHARRLGVARRIANKLVVSNAMTDAIGPRLAGVPAGGVDDMELYITRFMPVHVAEAIDEALHRVLREGYATSQAMVARNMDAITALADLLMEQDTVTGDQIRSVVERLGHPDDLAIRKRDKATFL